MVYREVLSTVLKSFGKLPRIFLNGYSVYRSGEKAYSPPFRAQIENSTRCNLNCQMCPLLQMRRTKGMMRIDEFKKIYDKIKPIFLNLTGYGESFLNPDIFQMVTHAKKHGSYIKFDTNGTILDREKADQTLASGLDLLSFSIDAADRKTYQKIRGSDKFDQVISNLKYLVKKRNETGSPLKIHVAMVVQEDNLNQLVKLIKMLDQIGIDKMNPTPVIEYDILQNRKYKLDRYRTQMKKIIAEYYRIKNELRMEVDIFPLEEFVDQEIENNPQKRACFIPWYSTYIAWNGDVFPCCYYYNGQIKLGNVFKQDFKKIWNSSGYEHFRQKLLYHRDKLPICASCELNEQFILRKIKLLKKMPLLGLFTRR